MGGKWALGVLVIGWTIHLHGITVAVAAEAEREAIFFARYISIASAPNKPRDATCILQKLFPSFLSAVVRNVLAQVPTFIVRQDRDRAGADGIFKFSRNGIDVVQRRFREHPDGWPVAKKCVELLRPREAQCWVGIGSAPARAAAEESECHHVVNDSRNFPAVIKMECESEKQSFALPSATAPLIEVMGNGSDKKIWLVQGGQGDLARLGLNVGLLARVQPEPACGDVQPGCYNSQNGGEGDQKGVGDFHTVAKEGRPEFGSLLASLLTVIGGMVGGGQAWRFRRGWKSALCFGFGSLMILDGTIGFLFGLDGWSIYRWWSLG